jgi:hypothetical protein
VLACIPFHTKYVYSGFPHSDSAYISQQPLVWNSFNMLLELINKIYKLSNSCRLQSVPVNFCILLAAFWEAEIFSWWNEGSICWRHTFNVSYVLTFTIFWLMTPCKLLYSSWCFGELVASIFMEVQEAYTEDRGTGSTIYHYKWRHTPKHCPVFIGTLMRTSNLLS